MIMKKYNKCTPFYFKRIKTIDEYLHYKGEILKAELYIVHNMYENEKKRRMFINKKMNELCPLLTGKTGEMLLHEYIWNVPKDPNYTDQEISCIIRRFQKQPAK